MNGSDSAPPAAPPLPVNVTGFWRARWARARQNRALGWVVGFVVVFLLLSLSANRHELLRADVMLTRFVQRGENPTITNLAKGFTLLGGGGGLAVCAVPALLWLLPTRRPVAALFTVAAISGHLLNLGIKALIHRPRPEAGMVDVLLPAGGTSFPSGHAMTAVMFFGFLAVLCYTHVRNRFLRRFWTATLTIIGSLIGLSRLYLGAHFFSDVVGGWTAGLFFLFLWVEAYKTLAPGELKPQAVGAL